MATKRLPPRSQIKAADTWDLTSLFADDAAWEKQFQKFEKLIGGFEKFRGQLANSAAELAACLKFDLEV
ncbi:MAG: oligoendopeptidase F, partial [Planctomycetota bacterium]